jgi:hypothetical protein
MALMHKILAVKDPNRKARLLTAFWSFIAKDNPQLQQATHARFYRLDLYMIPEKKHLNPISRTLIYELKLK